MPRQPSLRERSACSAIGKLSARPATQGEDRSATLGRTGCTRIRVRTPRSARPAIARASALTATRGRGQSRTTPPGSPATVRSQSPAHRRVKHATRPSSARAATVAWICRTRRTGSSRTRRRRASPPGQSAIAATSTRRRALSVTASRRPASSAGPRPGVVAGRAAWKPALLHGHRKHVPAAPNQVHLLLPGAGARGDCDAVVAQVASEGGLAVGAGREVRTRPPLSLDERQ